MEEPSPSFTKVNKQWFLHVSQACFNYPGDCYPLFMIDLSIYFITLFAL